jgi:hypothetical protein
VILGIMELGIIVLGVAAAGSLALLGVLYIREHQRHTNDRYRRTYLANFPRELPLEAVLNFMRSLSGLPAPQFLQPVQSVVLDAYGDVNGIKHYLSIPGHVVADVESLFRTHIVGGSLVKADTDLVTSTGWDQVVELGTSAGHDHKPLRSPTPNAVTATILSSFSPLKTDEAVLIQWVVTPSRLRDPSVDKDKLSEPNFLAVGRLASKGEDAERLIRRIFTGLRSTQDYTVKFKRRHVMGSAIRERIVERSGVLAFPITFNALELAIVSAFPFGGPNVPGLPMGRARHLAPDNMIPQTGLVLGRSSFPGLEDRRIAIQAQALMQHLWVCAPTGAGKSVLLHNIAEQVMQQGYGLVVLEPKSDLIRDILASVPSHRVNDVIVFNPTDISRPIGLNVLNGDPELVAQYVTSLMKTMYGDSWGPRLQDILTYTAKTVSMAGGNMVDMLQLLTNTEYRRRIVTKIRDHDIRQFWQKYNQDDKRESDFDSVLNKLRAFTGPRAIRNIVGQNDGLDLSQLVESNKIVLMPLSAAALGDSNAAMLGSLFVFQLWRSVQMRRTRPPMYLMLDEWHNYLNLSVAMEDAFAQARSYQLGLIVANQHTGQLNRHVLDAVRANARSKIVFGLNVDDAKFFKDEFAPMAANDLETLAQYEVAAKLMTTQGQAPTATLRTYAPPRPTGYGNAALRASRQAYGRSVEEVEREMVERYKSQTEPKRRPSISRVVEK